MTNFSGESNALYRSGRAGSFRESSTRADLVRPSDPLASTVGANTPILDLHVPAGSVHAVLGPSGCGKTTTLRCLAGLETPDAGRISFGDLDVFDSSSKVNLSPDRRNIGMVFQSYALWPHMTVRKNIAYPLKVRKQKEALGAGRVEEAAEMVELTAERRAALDRPLHVLRSPVVRLDPKARTGSATEIRGARIGIGFTHGGWVEWSTARVSQRFFRPPMSSRMLFTVARKAAASFAG
mgnify:CR=1 FL=1